MDIQQIKHEIMCFGASCTEAADAFLNNANPYLGFNKCVHSTCFFLNGTIPVNIPFREQYVQKSPYKITVHNNCLVLEKEGTFICQVFISAAPEWYSKRTTNGTLMQDVLCIHGDGVLSFSNYHGCYYMDIGKKCKFCSVRPAKAIRSQSFSERRQDFVECVIAAVRENPDYSLALSEGTINNTDRGAVFFSSLLQSLAENGISIRSSVELAPPDDSAYIELLKESGAASIIMNLEFSADEVRKLYCPGKGEISTKQYYCSLDKAVSTFGNGNVASVLICGIEPPINTINCSRELIHHGVVPILIPFKPYDNCEMAMCSTIDPDIFEEITLKVAEYYHYVSFPSCQIGCIACGACNSRFY